MTEPRLVIFDVDGTLVDSQTEIHAAMELAHRNLGVVMPSPAQIRSIVGLSLPEGFAILHPQQDDATRDALADHYRQSYFTLRTAPNAVEAVFFDGMKEVLDQLHSEPMTLLAVATGKSRRGLDRLLAHHGLEGHFQSTQVCDDHPSKPHPSMIQAAMADTGIGPGHTTMIGDTTYDIDMAHAAGVHSIGVAWGYHVTQDLRADALAFSAEDLRRELKMEQAI